jgi:hypothetical protein
MAMVGSPKKVNKPLTANIAYLATGTAEPANQPANRTKLKVEFFAALGQAWKNEKDVACGECSQEGVSGRVKQVPEADRGET